MDLVNLVLRTGARREPVRVDVGRQREEGARVALPGPGPGPAAGLCALRNFIRLFELLMRPRAQPICHGQLTTHDIRRLAAPEGAIGPLLDDPIALVRRDISVVVVAATPKTVEELRIAVQPLRLAYVSVGEVSFMVSSDVCNVPIDGEARVCRPSCTRCNQEHVRLLDGQGGPPLELRFALLQRFLLRGRGDRRPGAHTAPADGARTAARGGRAFALARLGSADAERLLAAVVETTNRPRTRVKRYFRSCQGARPPPIHMPILLPPPSKSRHACTRPSRRAVLSASSLGPPYITFVDRGASRVCLERGCAAAGHMARATRNTSRRACLSCFWTLCFRSLRWLAIRRGLLTSSH